MDNDTGVTVNGQVAMVFNDHFVANHVPLQEGERVKRDGVEFKRFFFICL